MNSLGHRVAPWSGRSKQEKLGLHSPPEQALQLIHIGAQQPPLALGNHKGTIHTVAAAALQHKAAACCAH